MNRECDSGFHGSLTEDLTDKKCSKCGRNYSNENFVEACQFFGIDSNDRLQIESLSDELMGGVGEKRKEET